MGTTAGLDVGGAHLKVAIVTDGRVIAVRQIACPLWQGLDKLDAALAEARPLIAEANPIALTMTGELSDLFPDRETGALTLIGRLQDALGEGLRFWMGPRGFGNADDARRHHTDVGSTNFLATATLAGRKAGDALLIDFGSTTADVIPISGGVPRPRGLTDADRQITGELVYTGFTRTAVMGVASAAPFRGQWVGLAREYLATMADVRRILGADLAEVDQHATADGQGKTLAESVTRFARMLGRDARDGTVEDWRVAAAYIREAQLRSIQDGAALVLSASGFDAAAPVVAAGIGAAEVAEIARRLGRTFVTYGELAGADPSVEAWATAAAPAVAVALLADA
ncbi:hydantoinase/oxoprolinase family protein [Hyphomicrobium sp.]|uniref:hydantoinase/oxoprolinase family protein n=1 Tax=Hyphomicrobium sp. TaxID=82 RepID=UPI002D0EE3CE|nr:hydantoinase/oxoprolinase family protein [Hyphomicrobium sp.]HRN88414.1 hydantoinase/oxoprolinase family protein [Hyphomicrobium sp.]HRQ27588.1 hydantoinase/oxoprolinase family protein [Hyphomicrobium sp.]